MLLDIGEPSSNVCGNYLAYARCLTTENGHPLSLLLKDRSSVTS